MGSSFRRSLVSRLLTFALIGTLLIRFGNTAPFFFLYSDTLIFLFSFLAIVRGSSTCINTPSSTENWTGLSHCIQIPLASLLSFATEELSLRVGQTLGGLVSFFFVSIIEPERCWLSLFVSFKLNAFVQPLTARNLYGCWCTDLDEPYRTLGNAVERKLPYPIIQYPCGCFNSFLIVQQWSSLSWRLSNVNSRLCSLHWVSYLFFSWSCPSWGLT